MDEALTVAAEALNALNRGQWRRVADLTDPDEVRAWYEQWMDMPDRPPQDFTAEEIRRHEPEMPEEVARYQAERANRRAAETASSLHGLFAGLNARSELARLEPAEALARYLQAQDVEWQLEQRAKANPRLRAALERGHSSCVREVVGVVHEGDERAHVLYRLRWPTTETERRREPEGDLAVATLRRTPAGWRLRLRGEFFEHHGSVVLTEAPETDAASDAKARPQRRTDGV